MVTEKKTRAGTGRAFNAGAAARENGQNGATRFRAVAPVIDREIRGAAASAAKVGGAVEDQIRTWVESFNSLGSRAS